MRILFALPVILLLTSCGANTVYETLVLAPPSIYLAERPLPSTTGLNTNGDLLQYCLELERVVDASNQDKASARAWLEEAKAKN